MVAIIQSSVVTGLALCAAWVFRRQAAATRHAILAAGLLTSLVAPVVPPVVPRLDLPDRGFLSVPAAETRTTSSVADSPAANVQPASVPRVDSVRLPARLYLWIWLLGVFAFGTVLIAGATTVRRLALDATPIASSKPNAILEEVAARLGWKRKIELLATPGGVLGTVGVLRPRVFLPLNHYDWSDERLRVVLTHELAHIVRLDWSVQVVAEIARAVYWFNPLFWIACRWLRGESEHACDDVVLNAGFPAETYAAHLLELARTLRDSGRRSSSVLAMSRPPNLERRFVAMLNSSLNHLSITRRNLLTICMMSALVALLLTAVRTPAQSTPVVSPPVRTAVASAPAPERTRPVAAVPVKAASKKSSPAPTPMRQGRADGSLLGTVMDSTGAVIPGVTLTVSSLETIPNAAGRENPVATAVSDDIGNFQVSLPSGRYLLNAELPGFTSFRKGDIEVRASETTRERIFLTVGALEERVEVKAVGQPRPRENQNGPRRIRVGGNVVAANLLSQVRPVYPQNARDGGIEGTVHLQGVIGVDGTLVTLRVVSSNDRDLANAALEAVRQWRYRPTSLNGEPIEVLTDIDVNFKLAQ